MPTVKLTVKLVEEALPNGKIYFLWDEKIPGFGLKVTQQGHKSWAFQYRLGGRGHPTQRYKIGNVSEDFHVAQAREEALHLRSQVRRGIDPQAEKRRKSNERLYALARNFGTIFEEYYESQLKQNRSGDEVRAAVKKEFYPAWEKLPLEEIERGDISKVVNDIYNRGSKYGANRALSFVKTFFRWAMGCGYIKSDPTFGMQKPLKNEVARDRVLTPTEISQLWQEFTEARRPFGDALKVLLQTAQRLNEVSRMRWEDLDLEKNLWNIPSEFIKNKRPHQIPLLPDTKAIIEAQPCLGDYVFTSNGTSAISGWSKVKRSIENNLLEKKIEIPDWRIHDLRRTVASGLGDIGFNDGVIGLLLNHQSRGVTAVYNRSNHMPQKRDMLEKWQTKLTTIVQHEEYFETLGSGQRGP